MEERSAQCVLTVDPGFAMTASPTVGLDPERWMVSILSKLTSPEVYSPFSVYAKLHQSPSTPQ